MGMELAMVKARGERLAGEKLEPRRGNAGETLGPT